MEHSIDSLQGLIEGKTKVVQMLAAPARIYTGSGAKLVCRWGSIVDSIGGAKEIQKK